MRALKPWLTILALGLGLTLGLLLMLALGAPWPQAHAGSGVRSSGPAFVQPDGTGTECSRSKPCSLQTALAQATDGDTIYVAAGTYTGTGAAVITLTRSITLYGGWDGAASGPVVRDPALYPTVLDGERARRVISITGDITPMIDGFIIARGNGTGLTADCAGSAGNPDGCGGGIFAYGAHPVIVNNVITNNVATIDVSDVRTSYGGGIYLRDADRAVISGNVVVSNVASTRDDGMGGGIYLCGSGNGLVVQANWVLSNVAAKTTGWGGGIAGGPNGALIQNNRVEGNQTNAAGTGYGAGIYQWYGSATYRDNLVRGNIGAHAVSLGYSNSRFEGNRILDNPTGTGLMLSYSSGPGAVLVNNVIARSGGRTVDAYGYVSWPLSATLLHNTLVGLGSGAGISVTGYVTLALTNNIVASATWGITVTFPASATVSADHTLFWANSGTAITGTNPVFGDPRFLPDGYHLGPGSAAVDAGANAGVTTDIDGDLRPLGAGYDIGADEARFLYLPLVLRNF